MEKERSIQRSIAWPASWYKALTRQAKRRGVPISAYVRYAVEKQLREDGERVSGNLMWGGYRYAPQDDEDEGQQVAVAVG